MTIVTLTVIMVAVFFIIKKIRQGGVCANCENCYKNCKKRK